MGRKGTILGRYLKNAALIAGASCLAIVLVTALVARGRVRTHTVTYRLVPEQGAAGIRALDRAASVVRQRMDVLGKDGGLKDWSVAAVPEDRLVLRFQARSDPAPVLFWLTMAGRVEFHLVHPDEEILKTTPREKLPEGYQIKPYRQYLYRLSRPGELETREHEYLVCVEPEMRVSRFAKVSLDTAGLHKRTVLSFEFMQDEAERFREMTAQNQGRQMAMVIDGRLFFPPRQIRSAVEWGEVQVEGYFYNPPLRKLVEILNTPPLPGRLEKLSHRVE